MGRLIHKCLTTFEVIGFKHSLGLAFRIYMVWPKNKKNFCWIHNVCAAWKVHFVIIRHIIINIMYLLLPGKNCPRSEDLNREPLLTSIGGIIWSRYTQFLFLVARVAQSVTSTGRVFHCFFLLLRIWYWISELGKEDS